MKITVVIPNYNGERLLEENLPKVLDTIGESEVVVVDDASSDGSLKILQEKFPKIKIIARKSNGGFSSAVNEGVRNATGELILLLNTDIIPEKNFLDYLTGHFNNPAVFAVGCLQDNTHGKGPKFQGRGTGKFEKGFLLHGPGDISKRDTLWVFGGAGLFRKSIWDKLGGLNEVYNPFYWEDIDISYRALKSGYKLIFEPKSIVRHEHEKGIIMTSQKPEYVKTVAYRNQFIFVWLNISDAGYLCSHFLFLPFSLLKSLVSGNFAFLRGFYMAILKIPRIVQSRLKYSMLWKNTDREVINMPEKLPLC